MISNETRPSNLDPATSEDGASIASNVVALRPIDLIITRRLKSREAKSPDVAAETAALGEIAALIAVDPRRAAKRALDWAIALCGAGSAGLSLLEGGPSGDQWFRWDEISGPLEIHTGGSAPRHFSPCGLCVDAGETILVQQPSIVFEYMNAATRPLLEGLITPLYDAGGTVLGTVWLIHHDIDRRFDIEDARILEEFAAMLVLSVKARDAGHDGEAEPTARPARPVETTRPSAPDERIAAGVANPFVRKLAAFCPLSVADESILRRVSDGAVAVPARTNLIREGDPTGGVFLMMEGMACRYRQLSSGRRQITAFMLAGDFCDLDVALLSRMDHAIMTLTPARVTRIPRQAVLDLTRRHGNIATALRKTTLVDEATLREWLVNIGSRPALERIAHLFCELQVRLQVVGLATEDRYELPITQIDLADTTGLSSVHVNRTLQELRRRGLITLAGRALTILDPAELRRLADFRADYLHLRDMPDGD